MWLALLLAAVPADSPRSVVLLPESGSAARAALAAAPATETPASLLEARKLNEQLRYEEAVVEYQRYLALTERPLKERAEALMELAFIHFVLGDNANAEARAQEAFEADPKFTTPASAPAKQADFIARMRKAYLSKARLEVEPRKEDDAPSQVRVLMADPEKVVARVLLRHALAPTGPFASSEMTCDGETCTGFIPPPKGASSYTSWYFVEALDATNATVARVAGAGSPLQLSVVDQKPWYTSPVVWGIAGAALVGVAAVIFLLAPQPPK
jgi:tetratricopeptide (TPR) repeat protein